MWINDFLFASLNIGIFKRTKPFPACLKIFTVLSSQTLSLDLVLWPCPCLRVDMKLFSSSSLLFRAGTGAHRRGCETAGCQRVCRAACPSLWQGAFPWDPGCHCLSNKSAVGGALCSCRGPVASTCCGKPRELQKRFSSVVFHNLFRLGWHRSLILVFGHQPQFLMRSSRLIGVSWTKNCGICDVTRPWIKRCAHPRWGWGNCAFIWEQNGQKLGFFGSLCLGILCGGFFFFFPCLTLFFLWDNLVSIMAWYQNTLFETDVWVGKDWFKETMS